MRRALPRFLRRIARLRGGEDAHPVSKSLTNPPLEPPAYRDRHRGRAFVVLGTGPSLRSHLDGLRQLASRHDCVVMGSNAIGSFLPPHYHGFTNRRGLGEYAVTIDSSRSQVLLGTYMPEELVRRFYKGPFERIPYLNDHEASFGIRDGIITASCRSASILLIGVALVMGAERIFVGGVDGFAPLVEEGRPLYAGHSAEYMRMQQRKNLEYFRRADQDQSRFLGEISDYMAASGLPRLVIVTPTVHESHYRPLEHFLR